MKSPQAHFDHLIYSAIQACAPEVAKHCFDEYGERKHPSSLPPRTALLGALLEAKGPHVLLNLLRHSPTLSSSPLFFFVLNAQTPPALIAKLIRHARYFHPTRHLVLNCTGESDLVLEAVDPGEHTPSKAEMLFTCGVLTLALEEIGCQRVNVSWQAVSSARIRSELTGLGIDVKGVRPDACWRMHFQWDRFQRRKTIPGLHDYLLRMLSPAFHCHSQSISNRTREELRKRVALRPSVEEVAARLGKSSRALQRALAMENTSFTKLLTKTRSEAAAQLLRSTEFSLREIGTLAGYADKAHFHRQFKKTHNMTPKSYRETQFAAQPNPDQWGESEERPCSVCCTMPRISNPYFIPAVSTAVTAVAPEVAIQCRRTVDAENSDSSTPINVWLHYLLKAKGPDALITLPARCAEEPQALAFICFILTAASPKALLQTLAQYDRCFHPSRRIVLREEPGNGVMVESRLSGSPYRAAEELFFYGVLEFLLRKIGCQGLQVEWHSAGDQDLHHLLDSMGIKARHGPVTQWRVRWESVERLEAIPELDRFLLSQVVPVVGDRKPVTASVEQALAHEGTERPSLSLIASRMGISTRTLQRGLAREQTSFRQLVTSARVRQAAKLLRKTDLPIAEVGFLVGFSDCAHFNREFKKEHDVTPREYRERNALNSVE